MSDYLIEKLTQAFHTARADALEDVEILRKILTDLINELRDVSDNRALRLDLADWAEDRLKELSND